MSSKLKSVEIYSIQTIEDGFGGGTEQKILEQTIHATMQTVLTRLDTDNKGSFQTFTTWIKTHNEIKNSNEKILKIESVEYRVLHSQNNRRRWFYQLERMAGD